MKIIVAGLFLLTALGLTGSWVASFVSPTEVVVNDLNRSALPVSTMKLEPITSMTRQRQFTGTVVAARRVRLAFERSARLQKVLIDEGQSVSHAQVLAIIDQRQLNAQVAEIAAGLQQQKAVFDELKSGPRSELIAASEADLAALAADAELSKATLDRTQGLFDRNATSAQALDEVRLAWKAAVARRDARAKKLEELVAGTRKEQIAAQAAVIAGLEAKLMQLELDVTDSELTAPFAGTIVRRLADEGDMLSAGQPILELLESNRLEARIGVPSSVVDSLDREGYCLLTSNGIEVTGRIRDVVAQVEPTTRTQAVVIEIDDAESSGLADGMLIRLKFDETQSVEGYRVPLTALAPGSRGLWSIYVVEPDDTEESGRWIVRSRSVEVLHTTGGSVVIRGAVYDGEHIISEGVHRVVPGQQVRDVTGVTEKG